MFLNSNPVLEGLGFGGFCKRTDGGTQGHVEAVLGTLYPFCLNDIQKHDAIFILSIALVA